MAEKSYIQQLKVCFNGLSRDVRSFVMVHQMHS